MMQRLPLLVSFILFLALCASLAYWALQLGAPVQRPVTAPPQAERRMAPVSAAENLFGGHALANTMTNMQLRGVIHAGKKSDSEAILVTDNEAPKYVKLDAEVTQGVRVKEIHPRYVVLDDHGVSREVKLQAITPSPAVAAGASQLPQPGRSDNPSQNPPQNPPQNPAPAPAAPEPQPAPQPAQNPPATGPGDNASGGSNTQEGEPSAPPRLRQPSTTRSATDLR